MKRAQITGDGFTRTGTRTRLSGNEEERESACGSGGTGRTAAGVRAAEALIASGSESEPRFPAEPEGHRRSSQGGGGGSGLGKDSRPATSCAARISISLATAMGAGSLHGSPSRRLDGECQGRSRAAARGFYAAGEDEGVAGWEWDAW